MYTIHGPNRVPISCEELSAADRLLLDSDAPIVYKNDGADDDEDYEQSTFSWTDYDEEADDGGDWTDFEMSGADFQVFDADLQVFLASVPGSTEESVGAAQSIRWADHAEEYDDGDWSHLLTFRAPVPGSIETATQAPESPRWADYDEEDDDGDWSHFLSFRAPVYGSTEDESSSETSHDSTPFSSDNSSSSSDTEENSFGSDSDSAKSPPRDKATNKSCAANMDETARSQSTAVCTALPFGTAVDALARQDTDQQSRMTRPLHHTTRNYRAPADNWRDVLSTATKSAHRDELSIPSRAPTNYKTAPTQASWRRSTTEETVALQREGKSSSLSRPATDYKKAPSHGSWRNSVTNDPAAQVF